MKKSLPGLINSIDENSTIHPCLNPIARPSGRIDSVFPKIHFMPNTDKTKWGKLVRRGIQAREGYKLITVDWSAQELITLGILSKNEKYIQAVNSGDQHVSTTIGIYSQQKIIECKVVGDEFYFKLNGNFEGGEEKIIYYMNKMSDENNRLGGESKNQDVGELGKSIWGKHKYNIRDGYYVISLDENLKK